MWPSPKDYGDLSACGDLQSLPQDIDIVWCFRLED